MKTPVTKESPAPGVGFRRKNMIFGRYRRLHFVGIGGAGMSGMAEILADLGYHISGSDNNPSDVTERLSQRGIAVSSEHSADNLSDAHLVVISAAVDDSNPEVAEAKRRGIPVIKRAEMLGELMRLKFSIGISGAHGKTTTTALTGHILKCAGLDPTVIVGGRANDETLGAKVGSGDYLVAEADEYDRSFLVMYPSLAVALNLEEDHLDCYRGLHDLKEAFCQYLNRVPFYGHVILNGDDPNLMEITPLLKRPIVTFGLGESVDYRATDWVHLAGESSFMLQRRGEPLGRLIPPLPGRHNLLNTLSAVTIALELDVQFDAAAEALRSFTGVLRRFERRGDAGGVTVYDDYAHHPTEVRNALEAARQFDRPLTVIFQPHLFSRTRDFAGGFADALAVADRVILVDIYPARERPIEGVTSRLIFDEAARRDFVQFSYVGELSNAVDTAVSRASANEVIFTMGAGDVCRLCPLIIEGLTARAGGGET
ncbi:MAG: UDP-N-acetylmuramate--L-alanine ligase [Candidatus Zixiibacteriota bacterium]